MSIRTPDEGEVRAAAAAIVDAFAATDTARYFALFAPDASFVFHPEPARLDDRAAYERLWESWTESGWRVLACSSADALVQTFPGGAVFSHTVATRVATGDGEEAYRERESIVFRVDADRVVAVHEHLSSIPAGDLAAPSRRRRCHRKTDARPPPTRRDPSPERSRSAASA